MIGWEPYFIAMVWTVFVFYTGSVGFWLFETLALARGWQATDAERVWDLSDVQVRIVTIDAEAVVQGTVDALPGDFTDAHVIAETPMDVQGAQVHVVPEDFECEATHKGRALEWARRNVACDREYVLYLDEDTIVSEFEGLPDADVIQFTELPLYTGSRLTYLTEVFRIGYQLEQRAFGRFRYPLYAWGGGIAIRQSLEETVTWDAATITEDTDFVWRAAAEVDLEFRVVDAKFRNQAPPSLRAMLSQRRRWMSGTRQSSDVLPTRYRGLLATRVVAWGFSPLIPALSVVFFVFSPAFSNPVAYQVGSLAQFGLLFVITGVGAYAYRRYSLLPVVSILATPLLVIANTAGALWGVISPIEEFAVTEKVPPKRLERVHPELEPGAFEAHDVDDPFAVAD